MWRYQTVQVGQDIYGLKNYSSPIEFVKYSSIAIGKVLKTEFEWVQDAPTPRNGASLINYLDQYILLSGGANPANSVQKLSNVELYSIEKNCWVSIPSLIEPRQNHNGCAVGNMAYVFGGSQGSNKYLNCIERLNIQEVINNPRLHKSTETDPLKILFRFHMKKKKKRISYTVQKRLGFAS